MSKINISSAPDCLNNNDKAMWVLGYNEAVDRTSDISQPQEVAIIKAFEELMRIYNEHLIVDYDNISDILCAMEEAFPLLCYIPDTNEQR